MGILLSGDCKLLAWANMAPVGCKHMLAKCCQRLSRKMFRVSFFAIDSIRTGLTWTTHYFQAELAHRDHLSYIMLFTCLYASIASHVGLFYNCR